MAQERRIEQVDAEIVSEIVESGKDGIPGKIYGNV